MGKVIVMPKLGLTMQRLPLPGWAPENPREE